MRKIFQQIEPHLAKIAIRDAQGAHTYESLYQKAVIIANTLEKHSHVAFQALPTADYVAMLWGIWLAGGTAIPISLSYPAPEVAYLLANSSAKYWLINDDYQALAESIAGEHGAQTIRLEAIDFTLPAPALASEIPSAIDALIIYTSGTTGKPKGAVATHQSLQAQIETLVHAWEWTHHDYTLHTLPLHHIHGVVNVLLCALWVGASIDFLPKFEAGKVWTLFQENPYTLYMAVPTIYNRLIEHWEQASLSEQNTYSQAVQKMRLMVSGSAALPTATLEKWQAISGHFLLERYGMTEIGMAISNPLFGTRKAGSVGLPLAGVAVRLVDEQGQLITLPEEAGEVQVKSLHVFRAYWEKPEATQDSFTQDGWFKTGDVGKRDADGYYYLLGRNSTDILKTGGYKVSALEIEEILLQHTAIRECAVVGIPDAAWGERVVAVIVWKDAPIALPALREWAKQYLAPYKVPMQVVDATELPRNAMGKVVKNEVKKMLA